MATDPFASDRGDQVGFAAARQAEAQEVVAAAHEVRFEQRGQLAPDFVRQLFVVEGFEGFTRGQIRVLELTLDFTLQPVVGLRFEEPGQKAGIAPVLRLGATDGVIVLTGNGRQPHRAQQQRKTGGTHEARGRHAGKIEDGSKCGTAVTGRQLGFRSSIRFIHFNRHG